MHFLSITVATRSISRDISLPAINKVLGQHDYRQDLIDGACHVAGDMDRILAACICRGQMRMALVIDGKPADRGVVPMREWSIRNR
jgi:hypothetical protein